MVTGETCLCFGGKVVDLCPLHGVRARAAGRAKPGTGGRSPARRAPIKQVSEKQMEREAYLDLVKEIWVTLSFRLTGVARCEDCGRRYTNESDAKKLLQMHHVTKRGQGRGFRFSDLVPGVDHPENLVLICDKCHRKREGR